MARTIQSPGLEIKEIDISQRPVLPVGTNVLVLGFAPQGPTDEVIQVADFGEFETIYGTPTNAAERYFYHSVKSVFNSSASVMVSRLPYGADLGSGFGNDYTALVYPICPVTTAAAAASAQYATYLAAASLSSTDVVGYVIGRPSQVSLTEAEYNQIANGQINWNETVNISSAITSVSQFGNAGMVVLNTARTTVNDKYEGYYLGIADTIEVNPATDYTAVRKIYSVNEANGVDFITIPSNRINFALSATYTSGLKSISEDIENLSPFDVGNANFADTVLMGVVKLKTSVYTPNTITLDYSIVEGYTGSFDASRRVFNQSGGTPKTFFIGDVEDNSPNIKVLVNPHISQTSGTWTDATSANPSKYVVTLKESGTGKAANVTALAQYALSSVDALFPLGSYGMSNSTTLNVGAVPSKVERVLTLAENYEVIPIDVTVEAGLGTIYAYSKYSTTSANNSFDDTAYINMSGANGGFYKLSETLTDTNAINIRDAWVTVQNTFINFAQSTRKDHIYLSDPLRSVFVIGASNRVLDDKQKTFSIHTYWPLKHLYANLNTSYGAAYPNWNKIYDGSTDTQIWLPPSGQLAAIFADTDSLFQPWALPAGFTRGRLKNVTDIAIAPSAKQRDMLYKIALNPITQFPNEGFVVFGQKTLFKNPSAFDRINVRRLFLWLEKATRATLKYYVFEPNTIITRNRVINTLTPIFELAKATEGVYDYLIVCDERNNTPTTIDNNELVVDIYIKPVRGAEFILVNFYATRTSQDFTELVG